MISPGFLSEEINFLSYSPSRMTVLKRKKRKPARDSTRGRKLQ
jgi:hypothetical protein